MDEVSLAAEAAYLQAQDQFNEEIAALRAENTRLRVALSTRERQLRLAIVAAFNITVNNNGGVGTGDKAGTALRDRLLELIAAPLPAWTSRDDVLALPTPPEAR